MDGINAIRRRMRASIPVPHANRDSVHPIIPVGEESWGRESELMNESRMSRD